MENRRNRQRQSKRHIIVVALTIFLLAFISLTIKISIDNWVIEKEIIEVKSSKLASEFDDFTIAHISDLHNAKFGKENKILISKIAKQKPDIIVITGDLIDSRRTKIEVALEFLEKAKEIAPIYFVSGNHEIRLREQYEEFKNNMSSLGVYVIDGKCENIVRGDSQISIYGVEDPLSKENAKEISVMQEITNSRIKELNILEKNNQFNILLSHRAEHFRAYEQNKIDLTFAGHAHGGQWRTPFNKRALLAQDNTYVSGRYVHKYGEMIVSRGLGNSVIPFRLNNNPHLIIAKLKAT